MQKRSTLFFALTSTLLFGVSAFVTSAIPQDNAQKEETKTVAQKCLGCHGPYDKLAAATADFKAPSGETVTPHRYVPHADKKDIPECTECHKPHPVPLEDKSSVIKPDNVDWCYSSCHHAQNFQPCNNCH
jgi:hypothetical protein